MNRTASEAAPHPSAIRGAAPAGTSRSLHWRLLVLSASALLPLALAAAAAMFYVVHDRELAVASAARGSARSIAAAVQSEIDAAVGVLDTIATDEFLANGGFDGFAQRARAVAASRGWRAITLADAHGRLVLSTAPQPPGAQPVEASSLERAIAQRAPVVGNLVEGPRRRGPAFAVRVPVLRDGMVSHVISGVIGTEVVLAVVKRQQLPETHVVAIFDPTGARVARSVENSNQRPSPSLQALLARGGDEGSGLTHTLEGKLVYTAFTRLRGIEWVVATGISADEAQRTLAASLSAAAAGLLASLALAAWLAWVFAGKLSRPIGLLKQSAAALGRGEPVAALSLDIDELQEVGAALAAAARERERATAEREALLAQANDALRRANAAARAKDEFLAVLGHELRNPLAPISGALRLMALKGDDATRTERRIVERQLGYMTRLVDDLLDISRITERKLEIRSEPMRVGAWLEQALDAVRTSLGGRQMQVDVPDRVAQSWIAGDEVRLTQVLTNLVGNAIKFSADNGRIAVSARRSGDWVEIAVADDGVGMGAEELGCVFDLFYQAPQEQHRARAGLGLGLSIVRSLVEMHGGEVAAVSDGPGRGSRFTLRLPATPAPAPQPSQQPQGAGSDAASGRVLVVDDNRDAADTAGALLEALGFSVHVAYTPHKALAALDGFRAQVAVLDIGLPEMDGYELARAIRGRPEGDRLRLIALTGYGQDSDVRRALDSGFDAHLTKPVDPDKLLALVTRFVDEVKT